MQVNFHGPNRVTLGNFDQTEFKVYNKVEIFFIKFFASFFCFDPGLVTLDTTDKKRTKIILSKSDLVKWINNMDPSQHASKTEKSDDVTSKVYAVYQAKR